MKLLVAIALAIPCVGAVAVGADPTDGGSIAPRPAHFAPFIAISVKEIEPMKAWYQRVFGFEVVREGSFAAGGVKFALLAKGPALIEMIEKSSTPSLSEDDRRRRDAAEVQGFFKSGLVVPDLDRLFAELKAANVPVAFEPAKPPGSVMRVFGLRDPEQNLIQVFGE